MQCLKDVSHVKGGCYQVIASKTQNKSHNNPDSDPDPDRLYLLISSL